MNRPGQSAGYTLTEAVIAMAITTMVVTAATGSWLFMVRSEKLNSLQSELDMDVRKTMENLKRDLRLSSLDKMYFYPPGPGPYTAISFPIAADTNGDGVVEMMTGDTNVLWTSTVIYHVWTGSPNELRRTVFTPRNNSLTPAQCQEQLTSVVTNGSGSATYGAANATSNPIFKNLFTWSIWGKSATFDGYSASMERDMDVSFGSILLGTGSHLVKLQVIDKNPASSGYKIGLDTLTASACGVAREGEAQIPPSAQSGATAAWEYMAQGSWSGNYQLSFPAASTGAYFTLTIDNDRWEETNFRGQGSLYKRTTVGFDSTLSPKDYIVQLEGSPGYPWGSPSDPYNWTAANQTGSSVPVSDSSGTLTSSVVRVLLRGGSLVENSGGIRFSGHYPYVLFMASSTAPLRILAAYIAEAADHTNYTANAAAAGTQLFFSGNASQTISTGGSAFAIPSAPFAIDSSKNYLITYLVDDINGNAMTWPETYVNAPGCYVIPGSASPSSADAQAADWSAKSFSTTNILYGIYGVYTTYPTNGLFTSQIFDTKIDTPVYSTISWNSYTPANTLIKIKVRTGSNESLSDAPAWSNVTAFLSSPANITCGNNRYIQFQAILDPDYWGWNSPKLKDVTIKWTGATKVVDIAATMTKGPNYGICEVTVDGNPLAKGLRIDLEIYDEIASWGPTPKVVTSSMTTEIEPRNTGK
jgi:type II secretory pathway pseudopilin PulG